QDCRRAGAAGLGVVAPAHRLVAALGMGVAAMTAPAARMESSLFSPRWYRVAGLRPQLRAQVDLKRQMQRGTPWYVLQDNSRDNVRRVNMAAYAFLGRCDGSVSVQQVWDAQLAHKPEEAMTQDEVIQLLVALHSRGLVQFDVTPDVENLFHAQDRRQRSRRRGGVNPMAFRLKLGDPSPVLDLLAPIAPLLFSGLGLSVWLLAVLLAGLAAAMHWNELLPYAGMVIRSPGYLLMAWLMYPLVKSVHELAHALALRRYGEHVRMAGVTLVLLNPVPFVDASAADGLRSRYQRALVSAAGIMAELFLAAVAMAVWLLVQPGMVRDIAFVTMLIGGLSTLFTNGNPLLRYDGYYVFCDLLDLRNLATRSGRYWLETVGYRLFGIRVRTPIDVLPGERFWLCAYAPASWVYRLVLSVVVGLWVGSISSLVGWFVGGMMLIANIGQPLWRVLQMLRTASTEQGMRHRATWRALAVCLLLIGLLGWLPLPYRTLAEGVVWLPEQAQIRADTDGFLVTLNAVNGQHVKAGELIASLDDPQLAASRATLAADAAELDVLLFRAIDTAPQDAPDLRERLAYARAGLARVDDKLRQREIRARSDGLLVLPHRDQVVGQFYKRGERIGYLLTTAPTVVRVALPQQDADLVRASPAEVQVRLADASTEARQGRIAASVPGASMRLPSAALGDTAGGRIVTDMSDKDGLTPRQPVVVMDVELAGTTAAAVVANDRVGGRALVRFDHGSRPVAEQLLRQLQQLFLGHFNPST
ncbi:biotin/lipoyl-binding protein, partial [Variovorax sp. HJSM1_2]|uniref:biotin/lipoyl-binding protein n=1 Tax=Variovorax sp. HJSM1_2 TaxID=3366263 RepID=UPI003BE1E7AD